MLRKLIVAFPELTRGQRNAIAESAAVHGFEVLFAESEAQALPMLRDAEVVFGSYASLSRNAPVLRWLCTPFAGVDRFLTPDAFASPDAMLSNSSGAYGVTISEHIVMTALEMLRRQPDYTRIVQERTWVRSLPIRSLHGSRIVLLGTGDIGQEAAARLRAFRPASIVGINRSGRSPGSLFDQVAAVESLDAALPHADLLIVSLPGTAASFHMLDARRLALLPDGALVINVGRGSVIDQPALLRELKSGRLQAALDVFEQEPIPADDPVWDCPNLLITPHVAGNTVLPYTVERIVSLFLEDFENYCAGRPLLRRIDMERGY